MRNRVPRIVFGMWLAVFLCLFVVDATSGQKIKIPKMTISTGSVGGIWYSICSSIADWVNVRVSGYPLTAIPGSGGMGNPIRIARGDADIGVTFSPFLVMASEGKPPYSKRYTNLRAICSLTSNSHHFLVAKNIEATNMEDIVEKKIGLKMSSGFPGDANYIILNLIFTELGMTEQNLKDWGGSIQRIGTSGRVDLWKDRHINALHSLTQFPDSGITEAMATRNGKLLGLTERIRDILVQKFKFKKTVIPADTYPGQDYPVPSVKLAMVLFTNLEAPEEAIYIFTKTVAESVERFKKAYGAFKDWESENMIENLEIPIHTGAMRYYKERGWSKNPREEL
jgi:TRAP transporter TAXI family solute receptor